MKLSGITALSLWVHVIGVVRAQFQVPLREDARPNIVFIITDDQDLHLQSLDYQPLVKKHLIERGTYFSRHYCTIAVCCPSRVSLLTGRAAHNTNVTDVSPPYGGYPKFVSQGLNDAYLPLWLQDAGYNTYYTGKLFNAHTVENYNNPYPAGWNGSDFLVDPYTYQYLNAQFQRNQDPPVSYAGQYSTDVVAEKALGFLEDASKEQKPFFLGIAPNAPHSNVKFTGNHADSPNELPYTITAPISAERHQHLFNDVKVPRTSNFNPDQPSGANWVRSLPQQDEANLDYNDHFYRSRLRALQAVDELVESVVERLETLGILDDTYILYTSDNGFHIGQHRLQPGKECGYEEDINIPLIVRGPGVPENVTTEIVTTHTDLAPTFFDIAGFPLRGDFDGAAIPLSKRGIEKAVRDRHEHVNVEYWGFSLAEGDFDFPGDKIHLNNTYKALRIATWKYNLYYSVWCNNEHELYDLKADPGQMNNLVSGSKKSSADLIGNNRTLLGHPLEKVVARLDALLLVLKSCKAETCVHPWKALHPSGDVQNLQDALDVRFDAFYQDERQKIRFERCEPGYILDAEGPQFDPALWVYREGLRWDEWV